MASDYFRRVEQLRRDLVTFSVDLDFALRYVDSDPKSSLQYSRQCIEQLTLELYRRYLNKEPAQTGDPLNDGTLSRVVGKRLLARLRYARELANNAAHHNPELPTQSDAEEAMEALAEVLEWWRDQNPRSGPGRRPSRLPESYPDDSERDVSEPRSVKDESVRPLPARRSWILPVLGAAALLTAAGGYLALQEGSHAMVVAGLHNLQRETPSTTAPDESALPTPEQVPAPLRKEVAPVPPVPVPPKQAVEAPRLPVSAGPEDVHWVRQESSVSADLYAVRSDAVGQVFVSGADGIVLSTRDGGRNWGRVHTGTNVPILALAQTREGQVFGSGAQGTLLLPGGSGRNGQPRMVAQPLPRAYRADLWAACGHSGGDLFVGGASGVLLQLDPQGKPRRAAPSLGHTIRSLAQVDEHTIYAVGDAGTALRGELRGGLVAWQPLPIADTGTLWALLPMANQLLVAGEFQRIVAGKKEAVLLRGSYPGAWQRSQVPVGMNPIYSLLGIAGDELLAAVYVASQPYLLRSVDGGTSWQKHTGDGLPDRLPKGKYALGKSPRGDLFIVGPQGIILHRRIPGAV